MKIQGIQRPHVDATTTSRRVAQRGGSDPTTKVAVSKEAKQLKEARSPAVSDPVKVLKLAQAIARGDFMIDAERLADRMVSEES
jgi:flagellar biosynthesis anti-sigma factor FlgM